MGSLWHENRKSFHEVCKGHYGRKMIVSNRSKIMTAEQAIEELNKALPVHNQNRRETDYLYHYGRQDLVLLHYKVLCVLHPG